MKTKKIITQIVLINLIALSSFSQNKDTLEHNELLQRIKNTKNEVKETSNNTADNHDGGVAISPSVIRFNAKPGATQVKTFKIINDTKSAKNFQIFNQDFGLDKDGQEMAMKSDYKFALSKYLNISPSYVELKPHESKIISVTASIPSNDFGYIAMWTTIAIDQVFERAKLEVPNANDKTIALGITTGMGFAIMAYQNPPNVNINSVEITKLNFKKAVPNKTENGLIMKVKNTGDGIGYCLYYIEVTNLTTGQQNKFKVNQFGILPGYEKEFKYDLPKELAKGNYSGLCVLDYGDKEALQTAEIDFKIE